ncbi:SubName: Full=Related to thymidylate kinase {ECO:0000313/EMBL:CCA72209.1} [Serendipita indica DSM 11827]|nr:SubName: Full=Related to thymidylate kinase {ECO:0000313/EMBL:CCA72209.1} [Serendipita indica DSM 11827]
MAKRGVFVVIEGLDRSGKSTQSQRLFEHLQEKTGKARLLKFPDRTTAIGKMIDGYLRSESDLDDRAIHLLFAANRWECAASIERDLLAGTSIVCDRYAFSGIAFSAAKVAVSKNSEGNEVRESILTYEWCKSPDTGLPAPDMVIFLDVTPEVARSRGGYGEERYEKEETQLRVKEQFRKIEQDVVKNFTGIEWWNLDASKSLDEISESIRNLVALPSDGVPANINKMWM